MKIITFNANGIRSAARKGFFDWLAEQQADIVCLQETKAQVDQLTDDVFYPADYHCCYYDAQRKGYSGTALYTRRQPDQVTRGLGWNPLDAEGRYIQADFGDLSVVSLYMPSGSSGDQRQRQKYQFLENILPHFYAIKRSGRHFIVCADWNICHKAIDLKTGAPTKKTQVFYQKNAPGLASYSMNSDISMLSAKSINKLSNIPGGLIAAKRGPKM